MDGWRAAKEEDYCENISLRVHEGATKGGRGLLVPKYYSKL